ncbi:sulfite exporter TauE/SafE family protein [Tetragenococcus halophilus]|uniref:sulfite exporter TauE/SafE family protein n=1 Tax=Tetragenococcus halophilus TaxID=51669 RepID=UPI0030C8FB85
MFKGFVYFLVIVLVNTVGAISGMGGGVIIKPVLDFIAADPVGAVSFYSSVAVFVMSITSTVRQVRAGASVSWRFVLWIAGGSISGGFLGNHTFDFFLNSFSSGTGVHLLQIILTMITLLFALFYNHFNFGKFYLRGRIWYLICGLILGFLASLLGIGGGPINVALLILMFGVTIKEATVYSICTIFFSQLSKLGTITLTTGFALYDLSILFYVIPAAIIGGFLGAKVSRLISAKQVSRVFEAVILIVLLINLYNGFRLFL